MRIVGGKFRNRALEAPRGGKTRPTSDRTRESIFNLLAHAPWSNGVEDKRVMDLFAGSGALGIEAISRGASFCLFIDESSDARAAIRKNIEHSNLFGCTRLLRRDIMRLAGKPPGMGEPFDLVFIDPPYGKGLCEPTLELLKKGGWLADDALIIVEMGDEEDLKPKGFEVLDERTYGAARVYFIKAL